MMKLKQCAIDRLHEALLLVCQEDEFVEMNVEDQSSEALRAEYT